MSTHYNLSEILKSVGAITDQDASLPTGSDLTQRLQFANDALGEWADTYTWTDLRSTIYVNPTNDSTTSLGLPVNFREPLSPLVEFTDVDTKNTYELVPAPERFNKRSDDKYCYIQGTYPSKALIIPNALPSGASLQIDYMSFPSSLATLTDTVPISATQYMVKKIAALVLQGRGDPRFPSIQNDAQRILSNAIEEQNVPFGRINRIPYYTAGFSIGYDG
jgi:hypothetical protein